MVSYNIIIERKNSAHLVKGFVMQCLCTFHIFISFEFNLINLGINGPWKVYHSKLYPIVWTLFKMDDVHISVFYIFPVYPPKKCVFRVPKKWLSVERDFCFNPIASNNGNHWHSIKNMHKSCLLLFYPEMSKREIFELAKAALF